MRIAKAYRDFKRIEEIIAVLVKYELGWLVDDIHLGSPLRRTKRTTKKDPSTLAKNLRLSMEELGGAFIKLGQLLSIRPDLIPKEFCEEFSKLQDNVAPLPFEAMKAVLEKELKKPLHEYFEHIDETPIASASIAQVYKARLRTGGIVAIKVQRPNLEETFAADIDLLYHIASLLEQFVPDTRQFKPKNIIQEFERYTKVELDFAVEARNLERMGNYFKHEKVVRIPKIVPQASSKRVLTMEFIEGKRLRDTRNFNALNSSREKLVSNIMLVMSRQVIEFGFFHADPHPGNILLIGDNKFALLDFGIVGELHDDVRERVEIMFIAMVTGDRSLFADSLINLGFVSSEIDSEMLKQDISSYLGKYYNVSLDKIALSDVLYEMLELARKYEMKLPVSLVLLIKSVITLEGLGKSLNPKFNFVQESKPLVNKLIKERGSSSYMLKQMKKKMIRTSLSLAELPEEMRQTLVEARKQGVKVHIDDAELSALGVEIDRSSNRITFGLLTAAFVLGAAVMMLANVPPFFEGISVLAIILLILGALTLIFLMISIAREKKR